MSNPALPPPPSPSGPASDVKWLIDASRVGNSIRVLRPGVAMWLLGAGALVVILPFEPTTKMTLGMVLCGVFIGVMAYFWSIVRSLRAEESQLDLIEDALALKRYPEVAGRLQGLMASPMRADQHRLRAMVLLATFLARNGRYDDALVVYNELTGTERVAGPSGAMVKIGRAMAMLQSDHLYDADRAITDLRRLIDRGGAEDELQQIDSAAPAMPADALAISALRLVELYRDVKTGHAEEAIASFEKNLPLLTAGLGHRVGEAHALVAVAYDRLNRPDDARQRFLDGTALQGIADILNRYPEVRPLIAKYAPTPAPGVG